MYIHTSSRDKSCIDRLAACGLSITYERVLQIEKALADAVCFKFACEQVTCSSQLEKDLYSFGAIDNTDYNPSSATA